MPTLFKPESGSGDSIAVGFVPPEDCPADSRLVIVKDFLKGEPAGRRFYPEIGENAEQDEETGGTPILPRNRRGRRIE